MMTHEPNELSKTNDMSKPFTYAGEVDIKPPRTVEQWKSMLGRLDQHHIKDLIAALKNKFDYLEPKQWPDQQRPYRKEDQVLYYGNLYYITEIAPAIDFKRQRLDYLITLSPCNSELDTKIVPRTALLGAGEADALSDEVRAELRKLNDRILKLERHKAAEGWT